MTRKMKLKFIGLTKRVPGTDENKQKTYLHFELWKNYDKQNPSDWLLKAH